MPQTCYQILGCLPSATAEDIKRAYRRLSKRYHPDVNPGDPMAAKRFITMKEAYDTLSNPVSRAAYDDMLRQPPPQPSTTQASTYTAQPRRRRTYRFRFGPALGIPIAIAVFKMAGRSQSDEFKSPKMTYSYRATSTTVSASEIFASNKQPVVWSATTVPPVKLINSDGPITLSGKLEYKLFESPGEGQGFESAFLLHLHSPIAFIDSVVMNKSKEVKTIQLMLSTTEQNRYLPLTAKNITVTLSLHSATTKHHHAEVIGEKVTIN